MKEQFVTYEIALKLKELGFNEDCIVIYDNNYLCNDVGFYIENDDTFISNLKLHASLNKISAPLWQQAIDWFREKYNYHIDITFRESNTNKVEGINSVYYDIEIYYLMGGDAIKKYNFRDISDDYHYAREQAILKAIELILYKMKKTEDIKFNFCKLLCMCPDCITNLQCIIDEKIKYLKLIESCQTKS